MKLLTIRPVASVQLCSLVLLLLGCSADSDPPASSSFSPAPSATEIDKLIREAIAEEFSKREREAVERQSAELEAVQKRQDDLDAQKAQEVLAEKERAMRWLTLGERNVVSRLRSRLQDGSLSIWNIRPDDWSILLGPAEPVVIDDLLAAAEKGDDEDDKIAERLQLTPLEKINMAARYWGTDRIRLRRILSKFENGEKLTETEHKWARDQRVLSKAFDEYTKK